VDAAASKPTLAQPTDAQRSLYAPCGQLALPGGAELAPAQLGLDGAAYAPTPARSAGPPLGPDTPGFAQNPCSVGGPPVVSAAQLELWDETWGQAPRQLAIWGQMRVRQSLVSEREAKCQRVRYVKAGDVELLRASSGSWGLRGVISCGRWACPACGRRRARETSTLLGACFAAHRRSSAAADQWMLTLTPVHRRGDELSDVLRWLYDASARLWRSREWRALASEFGISSRVRVLDATHGGSNGTHPHFHVALFVGEATLPLRRVARHQLEDQAAAFRSERARRKRARRELPARSTELRRAQEDDRRWELEETERLAGLLAFVDVLETSDDDTRVRLRDQSQRVRRSVLRELAAGLLPAWRRELAAAGCPHPAGAHAVDLAPSERAEAYFTKWGLAEEVGLPTAKDRSHLRLLDVVVAGLGEQSAIAGQLYRAFCRGVKGRAWVTGLSDVCRALGVDDEAAAEFLELHREREERIRERAGLPPRPVVPELRLVVRGHLWGAFLQLGHERVFAELDAAAERVGPEYAQAALAAVLVEARRGRSGDTS
jgi:hypothetical protein